MGPVGTGDLSMGIGLEYTPSIRATTSTRQYLASTENSKPMCILPNISSEAFGQEAAVVLSSWIPRMVCIL